MKSLKNLTGDSLEQLIDYSVVDQNGDEIGTLHSLWSDPDTGMVEFLGVKTGWLFGHNHVVPAGKAELDEAANVVRLPYTEEFVKEAPSISADAEISETEETEIYRYYGMTRETDVVTATASTGTGPSATDDAPEAAGAEAASVGNARWRRTSRPVDPDPGSGTGATGGDPGDSVRGALDDLSPSDPSGRREPNSTVSAGSYGTANLYGSTGLSSPVSADAAGSGTLDDFDAAYKENAAGTEAREAGRSNDDPITGEPGAHPVGTGVGAFGAGAAGAAIGGVIGGPVGAPIGAVVGGIIGAIGGGLAGKGVAESINPTEENAYWQSKHQETPYFQNDYEYSDYEPAYKAGYEGYGKYAEAKGDYASAEPELKRDYESTKGSSRLDWEKAKSATRDAWERLKAKASDETK